MKLLAAKVEMRTVKTIAAQEGKQSSFLLSSLNADCFQYPPAREAYERISRLVRKRTEIPEWEELAHDPVINEDNRGVLQKYKRSGYESMRQARKALEILDKYRKIRQMFFMYEKGIKALKSSTVDVDALLDETSDMITKSRTISNKEDYFFHFGVGNNVDSLVKKTLKGKTAKFIPTGFKVHDSINHGLPERGLVILAGATSAGKSTLAQQLSKNFAEQGLRVGYVPLEMDEEEMTMRRLANICEVSLHKITDAGAQLTDEQRIKMYKQYKRYVKGLQEKGGCETYFPPPEDMSIEEILFLLKPYKYKVIIIDYIGLLKGVGGDAAWQKLGDAARFAKIFAKNNDCLVILCAQLSDEGQIRYSKAVREHANNMWAWTRSDDEENNNIIYIEQQKCRMGKRFKFPIYVDWETMTARDLNENEMLAVNDNMDDQPAKGNGRRPPDKKAGNSKFKGAKTVDDKYLAA